MKDNTTCHDVLQGPLVPKMSRTTNNGKPRLQNPECSFNVFSGCLLHPCKFTQFSSFGFFDALDKCAPRRVYTICKIVPFCVFMPIGSVVASRSITTSKPSKQIRVCNTLISLSVPGIPKKQCQIHKSSDATASSTIVASRDLPQYILCHAFGRIFQVQCIQSRLPSMPGQPLLSLDAINYFVSPSLGARRYSGPKTRTITYANLRTDSIVLSSPMRRYSSA